MSNNNINNINNNNNNNANRTGGWETISPRSHLNPPSITLDRNNNINNNNNISNPNLSINLIDNNNNNNNNGDELGNKNNNENNNNNNSASSRGNSNNNLSNSGDNVVKLSKGEQEYEYYKNLANNEDFSNIISLNILQYAGRDTLGRPIVMILPANLIVKTTNLDTLLLYFIKVLDPIVDSDYVLVFVATNAGKENRPSVTWLKKAYAIFNRKYKKNLKTLYIVHPNIWIRVSLGLVRPFISNKFWKKVSYIDDINQIYRTIERCDIQFPDYVIKYNAKSTNRKAVFGAGLQEVLDIEHSKTGVPEVVEKSIVYLKNCYEVEGLFRKSADSLQVDELIQSFNKGEEVDMSTIEDPHAVAALLKAFLRQLPDPLFTFDLYEAFIQTEMAMGKELEVWLFTVKKLLTSLPPVNQRVIRIIFELLSEFSKRSNVNLMTSSNLAIVFAPNLLRSRNENLLLAMREIGWVNSLTAKMIDNYNSLWES